MEAVKIGSVQTKCLLNYCLAPVDEAWASNRAKPLVLDRISPVRADPELEIAHKGRKCMLLHQGVDCDGNLQEEH